jgi:hypothetical protein
MIWLLYLWVRSTGYLLDFLGVLQSCAGCGGKKKNVCLCLK